MNKAFVRESDATAEHCPRCGSLGQPVGRATLEAHLSAQLQGQIAPSANFCPFAHCDVVYFDMFERVVLTSALARPVYPKDPRAPICGCFGFTAEQIEQDLAEGGVARTKALLERARSSAARCATKSASGQSCVAEVQRYFLKRKSEGERTA